MKRIVTLVLIATALFISGCETFRGLGKDVEKAGAWVQEKAS
jgi:predicted small secreted protein